MNYYNGFDDYTENNETAITLGKFDGFHKGHQSLLEKVKELAVGNIKSVVCSLDMRDFLEAKGEECPCILTTQEKCEFLENQVDNYIRCMFTKELQTMSPKEFIVEILLNKLNVKHVVVGCDFRFGFEAAGDVNTLVKFGKEYGFSVHILKKKKLPLDIIDTKLDATKNISSSFIRRNLNEGNMKQVFQLLGYHYPISGRVIHGAKLGRTIGFPTMNIEIPYGKVKPKRGVYGCKILIHNTWYQGIGNVGHKPTVSQDKKELLEVHVFDYTRDTYGEYVKVELLDFIRPERKFQGIKELKEQIKKDKAQILEKKL